MAALPTHGRFRDLTGHPPIGRLTIIEFVGMAKPTEKSQALPMWKCRCECGNEVVVQSKSLMNAARGKPGTSSCGCLQKETIAAIGKSHVTHGMSESVEYNAWLHIRDRCRNQKSAAREGYGGRGICVDERWDDFAVFIADMGRRPDNMTSIDRIDVNGNYCKENCRWADPTIQSRNRRTNILLTHDGVTLRIHEWSERTGIPIKTLAWRHHEGWSDSKVVTTPLRTKSRRS